MTKLHLAISAFAFFSLTTVAHAGVDYTQSYCEGQTATQLSTGLQFQLPCDKHGELKAVKVTPPVGEVAPQDRAQHDPANSFGTNDAEDAAIIRIYKAFGEQAIGVVVMQSKSACKRVKTVGFKCAAQDDATEGALIMMAARFGSIPESLAALGK